MDFEFQQMVREAIQSLLDYTNAMLHIMKTTLVSDCAERCREVSGHGSTQTFYRRLQIPVGNTPVKAFFTEAELRVIHTYFCELRTGWQLAASVNEEFRQRTERLQAVIDGAPLAIAGTAAGAIAGAAAGAGGLAGAGGMAGASGLPASGLPASPGADSSGATSTDNGETEASSDSGNASSGESSWSVTIEIAGDKDYGKDMAGASSVKMVFLTGRTIIWKNKEHIRNALLRGTSVQIVFVDPEILNLLPEETWFGLCPLRGLLVRIEESIDTINHDILADLKPEARSQLEVKFTKAIPTTHLVIIEKDNKTLIWHTPYLPGIESRETYRYIFTSNDKNVEQFTKSFNYAFEHSRDVLH